MKPPSIIFRRHSVHVHDRFQMTGFLQFNALQLSNAVEVTQSGTIFTHDNTSRGFSDYKWGFSDYKWGFRYYRLQEAGF